MRFNTVEREEVKKIAKAYLKAVNDCYGLRWRKDVASTEGFTCSSVISRTYNSQSIAVQV